MDTLELAGLWIGGRCCTVAGRSLRCWAVVVDRLPLWLLVQLGYRMRLLWHRVYFCSLSLVDVVEMRIL